MIRRRQLSITGNTESPKISGRGQNPNSKAALKPWKPGQSGNPNGRPKLITGSMNEMLTEIVPYDQVLEFDPQTGKEVKKTIMIPRHKAMALTQGDIAMSPANRNAVAAAKFIKDIVEPVETEGMTSPDKQIIREMLQFLFARNVTPVESESVAP